MQLTEVQKHRNSHYPFGLFSHFSMFTDLNICCQQLQHGIQTAFSKDISCGRIEKFNLNNLISSYEEHIYKFFNKRFQPPGFQIQPEGRRCKLGICHASLPINSANIQKRSMKSRNGKVNHISLLSVFKGALKLCHPICQL